jgi:hypothetical protein
MAENNNHAHYINLGLRVTGRPKEHLVYNLEFLHLTFGLIFMAENIRRDFSFSEFEKKFRVIFNVTLLKEKLKRL